VGLVGHLVQEEIVDEKEYEDFSDWWLEIPVL
jgi:hypothetical protein